MSRLIQCHMILVKYRRHFKTAIRSSCTGDRMGTFRSPLVSTSGQSALSHPITPEGRWHDGPVRLRLVPLARSRIITRGLTLVIPHGDAGHSPGRVGEDWRRQSVELKTWAWRLWLHVTASGIWAGIVSLGPTRARNRRGMEWSGAGNQG